MDAAYFSGLAALAGSVIGGLTSLGATWLTQHSQLGAQQFVRNLERRETLYKDFINEIRGAPLGSEEGAKRLSGSARWDGKIFGRSAGPTGHNRARASSRGRRGQDANTR